MGGSNSSSQGNSSMNTTSGAGVNSGVTGGVNLGQNGSFGVNNSGNFGFNVGSGTSSGGSSSSSSSNDRIWGTQSPYLSDMYGQAQDAFNNTMSEIEGLTPDMTAQVQDAFSQGMGGFGNALGGGFAAGMMDQVGPNTYTDALKGDIIATPASSRSRRWAPLTHGLQRLACQAARAIVIRWPTASTRSMRTHRRR